MAAKEDACLPDRHPPSELVYVACVHCILVVSTVSSNDPILFDALSLYTYHSKYMFMSVHILFFTQKAAYSSGVYPRIGLPELEA